MGNIQFKKIEPLQKVKLPQRKYYIGVSGIDNLTPSRASNQKTAIRKIDSPKIGGKKENIILGKSGSITNSRATCVRPPKASVPAQKIEKQEISVEFVKPIITVNNEHNNECCIVVPIYTPVIKDYELASLIQCVKVLGEKYDIALVYPQGMDISFYGTIVPNFHFNTIALSAKYFKSQETYSLMCENADFYKLFEKYEYILIYQTDAWIFKDELHKYCAMGYDYIGAPHSTSKRRLTHVGNGGFSLRKVKKFIDACNKIDFTPYRIGKVLSEDCVFISINYKLFNLPSLDIAYNFSWQGVPLKEKKKLESGFLPMGCHAFIKAGWPIWKKYITLDNIKDVKIPKPKADKDACEKICYTAILGGYDKVRTPKVVTKGWKYICYSDVPFTDSVWEYRPMPQDIMDMDISVTKKQRCIKILSHKYLPEHKLSVYVDGNILIKTNLDDFISNNCKDASLAIPTHYLRDCLYEEAKAVVEQKREDEQIAKEVTSRYEREGFPHHFGLTENNVIIRKNILEVRNIMEQWWAEEKLHSKRDQLSLMYIIWKNQFPMVFLSKDTTRKINSPFKHDGGIHRG